MTNNNVLPVSFAFEEITLEGENEEFFTTLDGGDGSGNPGFVENPTLNTMYPETWTIDKEADYNNIVPKIQEICPSFQPLDVCRTEHAGILYVLFKADEQDLKKFLDICYNPNLQVTVHHRNNELVYRFGTNNDNYFLKDLENHANHHRN